MIYFDMDGVLVDFDGAYAELFGCHLKEGHTRKQFWKNVNSTPGFYKNLQWMPGMRELFFQVIADVGAKNVGICSSYGGQHWILNEKNLWLAENVSVQLGEVNLVKSKSEKKQYRREPHFILIDDMQANVDDWNSVFPNVENGILYKDAASTERKLYGSNLSRKA